MIGLSVRDCHRSWDTQEVIEQVEREIRQLLAESEIAKLDIAAQRQPHPLAKFAGMWKDDPQFDEFVATMQNYRTEVDADPNQP